MVYFISYRPTYLYVHSSHVCIAGTAVKSVLNISDNTEAKWKLEVIFRIHDMV
jgi:hypothetical protein